MNLTDLITLERPLLAFDTETTGPEPQDDRIVELGFILFQPDGSTRAWEGYINPTIPIPHEATYGKPGTDFDGHGITDEMVKDAKTFAELASSLLKGFTGCDFLGYNLKRFDLPLMRAEFLRAGLTWTFAEAKILDGFVLWNISRRRTLTDAVDEFLGREHEGAHGALADVQASVDIVVAQLIKFEGKLPRDLASLDALQFPRDPNALTPCGSIIWRDGTAVMNFGKNWKGKRLDLMSRRDLEWIAFTAKAVSPEAKAVCLEAYHGRYPVKA